MILKILILLAVGLSFPAMYFAPQYLMPLIPQYRPVMYFSSAREYYLFMVFVTSLPAVLGGLFAGWLWRWKGILVASLYPVSVIVTARIQASLWMPGAWAYGVPLPDVQIIQFGIGGTPMVLLATLLGAAAVTISIGMKRRLNVRASRTG